MRVLVTRIRSASEKTAKTLREHGHDPVLLPMFTLVDTGDPIPNELFGGYVFTSGNALEILDRRGWFPSESDCVAYCVGDETAQSAKSFGFSKVLSADGNAQDLARLIESDLTDKPVKLLYLAGVKRSFDLQGTLERLGIMIDQTEVYRIEQVHPKAETKQVALDQLGSGAVFFYSHNTAKDVCDEIFEGYESPGSENLVAVAISTKTADAVLKYPWQAVYVADRPTERSMVEKLKEVSLA
ncbi:MAG: uroporphyrinogen-III synthase [Pseudomonadota bacterium]